MNIVLFAPEETTGPLPLRDRRAQHILRVLRLGAGGSFDAGLIDGPRGKATILAIDDAGLRVGFSWDAEPARLDSITLIAGLPRPQTARKILEEATALGVEAMHFVSTQRGETSYAGSRLWTSGEWRRHLIDGAAQAFSTRLPRVTWGKSLADALGASSATGTRLALDNYESTGALSKAVMSAPVTIALGPERGWSAAERDLLRSRGFEMVHLGERVLRLETACVAAITLVKARLGRM
jgi:RsmE family RNA methyltransferase